MSEIKNGRLSLYGTECSKCNYMITLGFKGLTTVRIPAISGDILQSGKPHCEKS